jgi:hypothetical protein
LFAVFCFVSCCQLSMFRWRCWSHRFSFCTFSMSFRHCACIVRVWSRGAPLWFPSILSLREMRPPQSVPVRPRHCLLLVECVFACDSSSPIPSTPFPRSSLIVRVGGCHSGRAAAGLDPCTVRHRLSVRRSRPRQHAPTLTRSPTQGTDTAETETEAERALHLPAACDGDGRRCGCGCGCAARPLGAHRTGCATGRRGSADAASRSVRTHAWNGAVPRSAAATAQPRSAAQRSAAAAATTTHSDCAGRCWALRCTAAHLPSPSLRRLSVPLCRVQARLW